MKSAVKDVTEVRVDGNADILEQGEEKSRRPVRLTDEGSWRCIWGRQAWGWEVMKIRIYIYLIAPSKQRNHPHPNQKPPLSQPTIPTQHLPPKISTSLTLLRVFCLGFEFLFQQLCSWKILRSTLYIYSIVSRIVQRTSWMGWGMVGRNSGSWFETGCRLGGVSWMGLWWERGRGGGLVPVIAFGRSFRLVFVEGDTWATLVKVDL